MLTRLVPLAFAAFALSAALAADPPAPPPPADYDVAVRYRINAFSNERTRPSIASVPPITPSW